MPASPPSAKADTPVDAASGNTTSVIVRVPSAVNTSTELRSTMILSRTLPSAGRTGAPETEAKSGLNQVIPEFRRSGRR